ncbi:hypothetical protein ACFXDI_53290 [Streptomyces mirabilis]
MQQPPCTHHHQEQRDVLHRLITTRHPADWRQYDRPKRCAPL